eukprot:TRINITY_DN1271_c0_g1_i2.p1 TRINITY_DN1271_c0_g1~~TRINITY_DN1271_c0_g1_i2.p1  ORF type:complete len:1883 (-),score=297.33 TRINITY_DN1271_c0_g1_i2:372-6020(-)
MMLDVGKKTEEEASTEVVTLSEWMHESTMFNIITKLHFFKHYTEKKIFNIWKLNVRYRIFCKTRQKLIHDCFLVKPTFATHYMEMNQTMYDMQLLSSISTNLNQVNNQELESFKTDQQRARGESQTQFNNNMDKLIAKLEQVCKEVIDRTLTKETDEMDEGRFGKQIRQKPMNVIRKEKEERKYRLNLAHSDKQRLGNFIRLVDYMTVESLVKSNLASMFKLLEEMKKDDRKTGGLFSCAVMFAETCMIFLPNEGDIIEALLGVLNDMINNAKGVTKITENPGIKHTLKDCSNALLNDQIGKPVFKDYTENFADIAEIINTSVEYIKIKQEMQDKVASDFSQAQTYVDNNYSKCRKIYECSKSWDQESNEKMTDQLYLQSMIQQFTEWDKQLNTLFKDTSKGIVAVQGIKIKTQLTQFVTQKKDSFTKALLQLMKSKLEDTNDTLDTFLTQLSQKPTNVNDFANFIQTKNDADQKLKQFDEIKNRIEEMLKTLKRNDAKLISTHDNRNLEEIQAKSGELEKKIKEEATEYIKEKKDDMLQKLEKLQNQLLNDINKESSNVNSGKLSMEEIPQNEIIKDISVCLKELQQVKYLLNVSKSRIEQFKQKDKEFTRQKELITEIKSDKPNLDLQNLESKYNDRKLLWTNLEKFSKQKEDWLRQPFRSLNAEEIEKDMKQYEKNNAQLKIRIQNLSKEGKDKVLDMFIIEVKDLSSKMPIFMALGNKDLQDRHLNQIYDLLNPNFRPAKTVSFSELIAYGVESKKDQIEEISARASGEAQIEESIKAIAQKWSELCFIVNSYRETKDKFVLGSVEEIFQNLDDHQVSIQTMLGTRYVQAIRGKVEEWEKKLILISEILDEWLKCQRQWMYLENIFTAEDIQKQLPSETKQFLGVDKFWKDIMNKTNKKPIVLEICYSDELLRKFQQNNILLENIQKCLEDYLETKRLAFPRFYFLSNDELIEILSQTRNPHAVQPHLRKCFDNINRIKFTEEEDSHEIIAMVSAEPETMPELTPFSNSVHILPEDKVENWLHKIQEMMQKTLYDLAKLSLKEYPENGIERKDWLFGAYPAQCILIIDQVEWTKNMTQAITSIQDESDEEALKKFLEFSLKQMNFMVNIVRGELNTLQRTLMGGLMVLDVHARDVVTLLIKTKVSSINSFDWTRQLRYYWEADVDDCIAKQTNTQIPYSYEYLGNSPRLVITPLTDKCYMTLTGALHLSFGGNPQGPAGTGKTETTKDLAKALAIQCVVFNCSDSLDYKTMGRFFSGLAQCGAWSCFDEFNRINIEVLSVIAQQIFTIQSAVRTKQSEFEFEGRPIPLHPRFGVFITMNPGYAGRTELPDNLKALFRPISMMIPDYGLIAEIILFSEGFESAKQLANKMVQLYKLSSEQLSKQNHYDFGMRAVKSVLVMAGQLRRQFSEMPENVVLIRAMKDSNVPKFLSQDLPLFMGIIQDLFPGVELKEEQDPELQKAVITQLDLEKLQKVDTFLVKINQLMETIKVRHGLMLVGETGTGKTKCWQTLQKSLISLWKQGIDNYYYKNITIYKLNPKSVSMNELFGYVNVLTNEWADGIVANIVRKAVQDTTDYKKWIVFDGPVDALWIENLNTVLDDNKMLCLSNGQRIKLPQTFTLMFEVQDLAVASPATVSRCGMVYLDNQCLGWEATYNTWATQFSEKEKNDKGQTPQYVITFVDKLRTFFKENIGFIRKECKEVIQSVDINIIKSLINLVDVLYPQFKEKVTNLDKMQPMEIDNLMSMILVFCFIWSAGANLYDNPRENSRAKFSQNMRSKLLKVLSSFPFEGEVYDYYIDFSKKQLVHWKELIMEWKFDRSQPYFNILVPTTDTVKYKFFLNNLLGTDKNVLISGDTGVGKSVIIQEYLCNSLHGNELNNV